MRSTNAGLLAIMVSFCSWVNGLAEIKIEADYPGGNIVVERIEGDAVYLRQDLRDTKGWWFYWNFRVGGAEGRTLTFHFTNKNVLGLRGPAISCDDGLIWTWLGTNTVGSASFSHTFTPEEKSVRFAFAPPYLEADLNRFLGRYKDNSHIALRALCQTRKGRSVERLHVGKLDGEPAYRVLLTCRHHACESMASYVLEGVLESMLSEDEDGKWFQENVEVLALPFMDKDGVEEGDQGKNRKPRDHNRDYAGESLYASVGALRKLAPAWSAGKLKMAFDLHCPSITDAAIQLVGSPKEAIWKEQCIFGKLLETQPLPGQTLPYKASANIPFGRGWNAASNYQGGKSFSLWADELTDIRLCSALEIPYADAQKTAVTPERARAFGKRLAHAMRSYLEQGK